MTKCGTMRQTLYIILFTLYCWFSVKGLFIFVLKTDVHKLIYDGFGVRGQNAVTFDQLFVTDKGRLIIYLADLVGRISSEFSKMFRTSFGGTALIRLIQKCFVPQENDPLY